MSISYFDAKGEGFVPGDQAAGPWAPDMLHGRLLGGLAARALEQQFCDTGWRVARLTVDLFRPAGFELVEVTTTPVRAGRRIRVGDAIVTVGGTEVASARAVVLAEGTPPPGAVWQGPIWRSPDPESLPRPQPPNASAEDGPALSEEPTWDIRIHEGGFQSGDRARVWTNEHGTLLEGEPLTPMVRAALSADLASPLSNGGDAGVGYINGDYTLAMARYPVGSWVGLETLTHLAQDGIALGASTLYDLTGPFATSTTTALANPLLS